MNFSDFAVSKRKIDLTFFDNINKIVDWQKIEIIVKQYFFLFKRNLLVTNLSTNIVAKKQE